MTPPTAEDFSLTSGLFANEKMKKTPKVDGAENIWSYTSLDKVKESMALTNYPRSKIVYIVGPVEQTIPEEIPASIALLRLDTDWYESTRHELIHLYPHLVSRGVLILDDYGSWAGARKAADEYFGQITNPPLMNRIDSAGRLIVKP